MATEAALVTKIMAMLKLRGAYVNKNHGSPLQRKGRPDIEACLNGLFVAFEVKLPGKENEGDGIDLQKETLQEIIRAGGYAAVVTSLAQAEQLLRAWEPRSHHG